jgi:selenocysteine-specific elongation factor
MLPTAPRALKHNVQVEFYSGSAQIMAHVRLLDDETIEPGEEGWVQFRLTAPTAVVRGDRFIIRQPSPSLTIGGGAIVDPVPQHRHRRFRPALIQRLEALSRGSPEEILLEVMQGPHPLLAGELLAESGLPEDGAGEALDRLLRAGQAMFLGGGDSATRDKASNGRYVMATTKFDELVGRMEAWLEEYHQRYPLRVGMPREELKSKSNLPSRVFSQVLERAALHNRLAEEGTVVRLPQHQVTFSDAQQRRIDELMAQFAASPYSTPSVAECEAAIGLEALNVLLDEGRLVRVSETVLFLADTYREMVERVVAHIEAEGSITVAQVRDMFQASRKYALALMEHLDDQRVTKRVGDERVLR